MAAKLDLGQNVPPWLPPLVFRLLGLRAPGIYELILVVEEDGSRSLVTKNGNQPYRIEALTSEEDDTP